MRYLSVCSGIEAASVAWEPLGWKPVGFSEIEPFPSRLLAYRYPDVPNLGDMNNYKRWNIESPDLLVGGTPCQSFSVAGLRQGLVDPRGNLALVYCGILARFRPTWFVWENVPGVLSSSGGRDFGSLLAAVGELGYGFVWRVLDAEHFGVPQRRRRIFLVGHSGGNWRRAAAVLFDEESCIRNSAESDSERLQALRATEGGTDRCWWNGRSVSQTLDAVLYKKQAMPEKNRFPAVLDGGRARFITPLEAERLQGFPDGWTDVPGATDTARYKALGNSMPVPVMRWIGERIAEVNRL